MILLHLLLLHHHSIIRGLDAILNLVFGAKLFEIIIRIPTVAISSFVPFSDVLYFSPATSSTVATVSPFGPLTTLTSFGMRLLVTSAVPPLLCSPRFIFSLFDFSLFLQHCNFNIS